jgi:hypothetical protein
MDNLSTGPPGFGRWLLLATSVLQGLSPILIDFRADDSVDDPALVPPPYFFAIWGVILAGCCAVAVWGFPSRRASTPPYSHIQVPLSLAQVCCFLWCLTASSPKYTPLTAPIFMVLIGFLVQCLGEVQKSSAGHVGGSGFDLLSSVLGIYAGWSTPAVWINVATTLPKDWINGTQSTLIQCGFVAAASASALIGTYFLRGQVAYSCGSGWALIGVIISAREAGIFPLMLTAVGGLVGLVTLTIFLRTS